MQKIAGEQFMDWTQEAVVGLWDVMVKYPYFREKFYRMYRDIRDLDPDAVIFVDYPGFNLRLAHYLRRKQFSAEINLLYQSSGLGLEPGQNTAHGSIPGFDDLHLSIREIIVRSQWSKN